MCVCIHKNEITGIRLKKMFLIKNLIYCVFKKNWVIKYENHRKMCQFKLECLKKKVLKL